MSISASLSVRNARLQAVIDKIDSGEGNGSMRFFSAPRPPTGGAETILIAVNELFDPSGSIGNGELTFNLISDETSTQSNDEISWCRIVDGDGIFLIDMDCGLAGSGAEVIFDDLVAQIGGTVKILSGLITEGNL